MKHYKKIIYFSAAIGYLFGAAAMFWTTYSDHSFKSEISEIVSQLENASPQQKSLLLNQLMVRAKQEIMIKKIVDGEETPIEQFQTLQKIIYQMTVKNEGDIAEFKSQAYELAELLK